MSSKLVNAHTFNREREIRELLKEQRYWGEKFGRGYELGWDERAMRIIRSEQARIRGLLLELGWQ